MLINYYCFDVTFEFFFLFFTLYLLCNKSKMYISFLINFEFGWIIIYTITVLLGLKYNLIMILALIFFILVFSSIELSIGFLVINFSHKLYNNNNTYQHINKIFRLPAHQFSLSKINGLR